MKFNKSVKYFFVAVVAVVTSISANSKVWEIGDYVPGSFASYTNDASKTTGYFSQQLTFTLQTNQAFVASVTSDIPNTGIASFSAVLDYGGITKNILTNSSPTSGYTDYSITVSGGNTGETFAQQYTVNLAAVPEPETFAMMLLGLGLVGVVVRRCRDGAMQG